MKSIPEQMATAFDDYLTHLVTLASKDAFKQEAWRFAKELSKCDSGLWTGIDDSLVVRMKELKGST